MQTIFLNYFLLYYSLYNSNTTIKSLFVFQIHLFFHDPSMYLPKFNLWGSGKLKLVKYKYLCGGLFSKWFEDKLHQSLTWSGVNKCNQY